MLRSTTYSLTCLQVSGVHYAGDMAIRTEIELDTDKYGSLMPKLTADVRNISLTSPCLRIHLRPLLPVAPFVEKVTLSFAQKPHFDFDLEGSGTFNYLNLGNLLRHVIHDQLEETVVMPNSFTLTIAQRQAVSPDNFFLVKNRHLYLLQVSCGVS